MSPAGLIQTVWGQGSQSLRSSPDEGTSLGSECTWFSSLRLRQGGGTNLICISPWSIRSNRLSSSRLLKPQVWISYASNRTLGPGQPFEPRRREHLCRLSLLLWRPRFSSWHSYRGFTQARLASSSTQTSSVLLTTSLGTVYFPTGKVKELVVESSSKGSLLSWLPRWLSRHH